MTTTAPKKWTKEEIKLKLVTDNRWLIKGLLAIYNKQTEDEKSSEITKHDNGVGFSACHSNILTSYAKFYNARGFLTEGQYRYARRAMQKYAGQLARIANHTV
jgi:hypothetical protein